jgi:hypothetical protein
VPRLDGGASQANRHQGFSKSSIPTPVNFHCQTPFSSGKKRDALLKSPASETLLAKLQQKVVPRDQRQAAVETQPTEVLTQHLTVSSYNQYFVSCSKQSGIRSSIAPHLEASQSSIRQRTSLVMSALSVYFKPFQMNHTTFYEMSFQSGPQETASMLQVVI